MNYTKTVYSKGRIGTFSGKYRAKKIALRIRWNFGSTRLRTKSTKKNVRVGQNYVPQKKFFCSCCSQTCREKFFPKKVPLPTSGVLISKTNEKSFVNKNIRFHRCSQKWSLQFCIVCCDTYVQFFFAAYYFMLSYLFRPPISF